ncbi:Tex family protein [Rothia sp. CCM 9418]|uniref:Tex family protein n=1 Tax=unclassified Rothia (in: high G+C Gram-positive bacteria) TaxID=2689056 RepID=UPI003AC83A02
MNSPRTDRYKLEKTLAGELGVPISGVRASIRLLDEGATVPFIARYRKEHTGGMSDTQLRELNERLEYLRDLEQRRHKILELLAQRGVLEESLQASVLAANTKNELESLYAPYKIARRTRAQCALEAGLEPLVDDLLEVPLAEAEQIAQAYVRPSCAEEPEDTAVLDAKTALEGARAILEEYALYDHELMEQLRERLWSHGVISSRVLPAHREHDSKFSDYFHFSEPLRKIPSHRVLALMRAEKEGVVELRIEIAQTPEFLKQSGESDLAKLRASSERNEQERYTYESTIAFALGIPVQVLNTVSDEDRVLGWLASTVRSTWKNRILPRLTTQIRARLREHAEKSAIDVFSSNLRDLLLAAPAGERAVLALDPGLRTGVKVAALSALGEVLDTTVIYPHAPKKQWAESLNTLAELVKEHHLELVSIGNGTASRDTDKLASELLSTLKNEGISVQKVTVSEAGASVYSASALASEELPDLDVSLRGAVSIGRRLQDPLAELVKVDPQSIGVGQYQHDISAHALRRSLDATVEDCVNSVGVWVNSASVELLSHVAGLNRALAQNIVNYRQEHGAFKNRQELLNVSGVGAKTFEQAAGFIRIRGGDEPLDASAVHPESYELARRLLQDAGVLTGAVIPSSARKKMELQKYLDEGFGTQTLNDILDELETPGRDPRPTFRTVHFTEGVETIHDVKVGMILEGTVSNVAGFGAFVDIGVHQDGLIHVSQMSTNYVQDPHHIVRSGDIVQVRVTHVDTNRGRIALSLLLEEEVSTTKKNARRRQRRA